MTETKTDSETNEIETTISDELAAAATKAVFYLSLPAVWADRDAPLTVTLWRWRFVYTAFLVFSVPLLWTELLQGEWYLLMFVPVLHTYAALAAVTALDGSTPIVGPVVGSDLTASVVVAVACGTVLVGEGIRRQAGGIGPLPAVSYYRNSEEEVLVPFTDLQETSTDGDPLARLDQDTSTAVVGETGAGKTEAMKLLTHQLPTDEETAIIVHEMDDTLAAFFRKEGYDIERVSLDDPDVTWNLFRDIRKQRDLREVADTLFGEPDGHDPFHNPAKQVFHAGLKYLRWEAQEQDNVDKMGHDNVFELFDNDQETLYTKLGKYDALDAATTQIVPDTNKGENVYSTLREHVAPVFVGSFAEHGEFSLRDYLEEPDGRVVVLQTPSAGRATAGPMFRLLIAWAIRHGMDVDTSTLFLLDEIDQLPAVEELPDLAARGRSENARTILGVQTIAQLRQNYGRDGADAVLGNCPQGLYFAPGDETTTEAIQAELGQRRETDTQRSVTRSGQHNTQTSTSTTERTVERCPVSSEELKRFDTGDAVVKARSEWWVGSISELEDVRQRL